MSSEFVDDLEIKTEIEIEEWKPPDVSGLETTSSHQNQLFESNLYHEIKNSANIFDISKGPKIELKGL